MADVIKYLLLTVEVVVGFLLIAVILLQRTKDQGLGLAFGSGMGEALFGARTGNVLTKITVVLAIVFFLDTVMLARIFSAGGGSGSVLDGVQATAPAVPGPATPGGAPPPVQPAATPTIPADTAMEMPAGGGVTIPADTPVGTPGAVETTTPTIPAPVETPPE
jgi:preprotein translocase subunit SecG